MNNKTNIPIIRGRKSSKISEKVYKLHISIVKPKEPFYKDEQY